MEKCIEQNLERLFPPAVDAGAEVHALGGGALLDIAHVALRLVFRVVWSPGNLPGASAARSASAASV